MRYSIFTAIKRCCGKIGFARVSGTRPSASGCARLFLFMALLIPTHPFQDRHSHWLELVDRAEGKEVDRKLGIYSVLKLHGRHLSEESSWAITESIDEESKKQALDPMLILAVITVESRFQHTVVSAKGARGLMQIRPLTAQGLGKTIDLKHCGGIGCLNDPVLNIRLGTLYLGQLKKRFRDLTLALAAYNSGPTEIQRRLETGQPIPRRYAVKVLSVYRRYRKQPQAS